MIGKQDFARGLIAAMRKNATVGILMDTNMTPPQGVFVDFFGIPACTASGMARVALHTGAAVVPAFTIWDPVLRKYRVEFDRAVELVRTGDDEADAVANTALFNQVHRRAMCAAIPTSGSGCIAAGRPGRRASQAFTSSWTFEVVCPRLLGFLPLSLHSGCNSKRRFQRASPV